MKEARPCLLVEIASDSINVFKSKQPSLFAEVDLQTRRSAHLTVKVWAFVGFRFVGDNKNEDVKRLRGVVQRPLGG